MRRNDVWPIAACAALLLIAGGCAARRQAEVTYHDENMDFSLVRTVAVLPFSNLSTTQTAAERVRDTFMTMLQATGQFYVLPPGEILRGLSRVEIQDPTHPSAEQVVALGKAIGADAVITGTVLEYGEARSGSASANYISMSVDLMETSSGKLVWSASSTKGGVTSADRMFGGGGQPMNDVTAGAVNDLLDKLFAKK